MKKLLLLILFISATFILVVKFDTYTAVRRDQGAFHKATLTINDQRNEHQFHFENPIAFQQAYQLATIALARGRSTEIQGTRFEPGAIVNIQVRTKLHDGISPTNPSREWAESLLTCRCAERAKRDFGQRFLDGLQAIQHSLLALLQKP